MTNTSRDMLEIQADKIEALLAQHESLVCVSGGVVGPRWVKFNLTPAIGTRFKRVQALAEEIALALGTSQVRVSRSGAALQIDVPRPDPQTIKLLELCRRLSAVPLSSAVLGITDDGAPLLVRLEADDVQHVLISGREGVGKTSLLTSMLVSLMLAHSPEKLKIVTIGDSLKSIATMPNVFTSATLDDIVQATEQRTCSKPLIVVAVDDATRANRNELIALTHVGASVGVHVIAVTRNGDDLSGWFPQHIWHDGEDGVGEFESSLGRFLAAHIDNAQLATVQQGMR